MNSYTQMSYSLYEFGSEKLASDYLNAQICSLLNAESVFYPTHDNKIFVVHKINSILKENYKLSDDTSIVKLQRKRENEIFDTIYVELSKENSRKLQKALKTESDSDFERCLAIKKKMLNELKTELYRVDSYQLKLIEHLLTQQTPLYKNEFQIQNPKSSERFEFHAKLQDITIQVFQGNLIDQKVTCIVNAANDRLQLLGGVAGAILEKGGRQIQRECDDFLAREHMRSIAVGNVVMTSSGNLTNCSWVLHAVGPCWHEFNDKSECLRILQSCFSNCLKYVYDKSFESVALPLISSGIFGVPREECCKCLLNAIVRFLDGKNKSNLKRIIICNIDKETNKDIIKHFNNDFSRFEKLNNLNQTFNQESKIFSGQIIDRNEKKEDLKKSLLFGKCILCEESRANLKKPKENCDCLYCKECYPNYEQTKTCECKP